MEYSDLEQRKIFSENLRRYVKHSGKDQKSIAHDLLVNPPTFNQWVNGKAIPSVSTLKKIADYFNVLLTDLVDPCGHDLAADYIATTEAMHGDINPEDTALIEIVSGLSDAQKDRLISYAKFLAENE